MDILRRQPFLDGTYPFQVHKYAFRIDPKTEEVNFRRIKRALTDLEVEIVTS